MVAIAVVAVMTGGTSSAQNALETTLAREEIDTQAEALRFIHASYLADEESGNNPFNGLTTGELSSMFTYTTQILSAPESCHRITTKATSVDTCFKSPINKDKVRLTNMPISSEIRWSGLSTPSPPRTCNL